MILVSVGEFVTHKWSDFVYPTYIYLKSGKTWTFLAKDLRLVAFAPFGRDTLIAGRWRRCLQLYVSFFGDYLWHVRISS